VYVSGCLKDVRAEEQTNLPETDHGVGLDHVVIRYLLNKLGRIIGQSTSFLACLCFARLFPPSSWADAVWYSSSSRNLPSHSLPFLILRFIWLGRLADPITDPRVYMTAPPHRAQRHM
jgi:hypothetical protein